MFRNTLTFTIAIGLIYNSALARELKEFDNNVNYDESKVPHYDLPDPLTTAEGTAVTNAKQWRNIRRPQILSLFANFIYGTVPTPPDPIQQSYQIIKEDKSFLDNKATKLDISIRFKNRKGTAQTHIIVFIPNQIEKPAPAFMMMSFDSPRGSSSLEQVSSDDLHREADRISIMHERQDKAKVRPFDTGIGSNIIYTEHFMRVCKQSISIENVSIFRNQRRTINNTY